MMKADFKKWYFEIPDDDLIKERWKDIIEGQILTQFIAEEVIEKFAEDYGKQEKEKELERFRKWWNNFSAFAFVASAKEIKRITQEQIQKFKDELHTR